MQRRELMHARMGEHESMHARMGEPESMHARMWGGLLQDTVSPTGDMVHYIIYVRIRVRIDPPHPLVCRKRRLNGADLRMRPKKTRSRVTTGVAR